MKRYELRLPDGRTLAVRATVSPSGAAEIEIDGETIRLAAGERFEGAALRCEGRLLVSHPEFQGECEFREVPRHASGAAHGGAEASDLRAPFPGKVVKVLVSAPLDVAKGEALVVLEAMKMEFTYTAPKDLRIEKVLVREGQQLDKGAPFFEFA